MSRASHYLALGDHELHVSTWGSAENPALVLWHGLARNGRDFDELAQALSDRYFVLCPDTIGRGLSSWAAEPARDYRLPTYVDLAAGMLDAFGKRDTAWLGTSMGGQVGMCFADRHPERTRALIINDIGPKVPEAAMDRIVTYSAALPSFAGVLAAEKWLREVYIPFGPAHDPFWTRMAECSTRRMKDGQMTLHYDPRIIAVLDGDRAAMELWPIFDRLTLPMHVLRGVTSDLLTAEIAQQMTTRGPKPEVTEFPEAGHAPSLTRAEDHALVRRLLGRMDPL